MSYYKQIDKPFNEQIESVKQALDNGSYKEWNGGRPCRRFLNLCFRVTFTRKLIAGF